MTSRRLPVLVSLALLLVAAIWIQDRGSALSNTTAAAALDPGSFGPLGRPLAATSATWFCAAGTGVQAGAADHIVFVANPTDRALTARLDIYGAGVVGTGQTPGTSANHTIVLGPHTTTVIRLGDLLVAPWVAALVSIDGAGVVTHQVGGGAGGDIGRCASLASSEWYFPWGQTALGSTLQLALFNPFPGDAVVDLSFATDEGYRTPEDFESLLVPARSLAILDIGAVVTRRQHVSTAVKARKGQVVAEMVQTTIGTSGEPSLDMTLGAPAAASTWYFASGRASADVVERFVVYNPSERSLEAELTLIPEVADVEGQIEPFQLRVGPKGYAEIVLNREPRVSLPSTHAAVIQVLGDLPIVAERVIQSGDQAPAVPLPVPRGGVVPPVTSTSGAATSPTTSNAGLPGEAVRGLAAMMGSPIVSKAWLTPAITPLGGLPGTVTVFNPAADGTVTVTATVFGMTPQDVVVKAGTRRVLVLPTSTGAGATGLILTATGPIIAEQWSTTLQPPDQAQELLVPLNVGAVVANTRR